MNYLTHICFTCLMLLACLGFAQEVDDTPHSYKKRVLENTEIDLLSSYYTQEGENAAVSAGIGTEAITDVTGTIVVSIPLNDDDVLSIDAGISAYTSASSSNVDPFDKDEADPFQASSGASSGDVWANLNARFSHSSDDRNTVWSASTSIAAEYDYFSLGFGGAYSKLMNEKNTELSINAHVFIDNWNDIYPKELRSFAAGKNGIDNSLFKQNVITGNANYKPIFSELDQTGRNSYSVGLAVSQILHKHVQASLAFDFIQQQGLLSTPFQRVNFSDFEDSFIDKFQLADAIERLPDSRIKLAIGSRLHWYLNEQVTLRTFYRYYRDDWGISSQTASLEIPIKISDKLTLYPSYRFYNQSAADYFNPHELARSTDEFYTSDYDLSNYNADQLGFGISYTDILTDLRVWKYGLKSIDLKFYQYNRNSNFRSSIFTLGIKFVVN